MMYQKNKFPFGYIKDLKCRVLELPYEGKDLSMVILLPDDIRDEATGLKKVRLRSPRGAQTMCVCGWVGVFTRVHASTCVCSHVCEHLCMFTRMWASLCVFTHVWASLFVCSHVCMHLCVFTHMSISVHTCVSISVFTCV